MHWRGMLTAVLLSCAACDAEKAAPAAESAAFTVVSWNVGTVGGPGSDPAAAGFGKDQRSWSDELYGNGLAFEAAIADVQSWLLPRAPDIVALQEVFDPEACASIPAEAQVGFVCAGWLAGNPTVAQRVVPAGYTVACHPGKPDKCIAVKNSFASIDGCSGPLCLDAGSGFAIAGCGKGARAAHFVLRRPSGAVLHVRHIHGNSGLADADKQCRKELFQLALANLESGTHLILGDFNTDPVRFAGIDPSADVLAGFAEEGKPLQFLTDTSAASEPTYGGVVSIDHVLVAGLQGSCAHAGITPGLPAATEVGWFDHHPVACTLQTVTQ